MESIQMGVCKILLPKGPRKIKELVRYFYAGTVRNLLGPSEYT